MNRDSVGDAPVIVAPSPVDKRSLGEILASDPITTAPAVIERVPTALSIVQQFAADPNFDVAKLKALLDMKAEEDARAARMAFFRDLALCQEAIPAVIRDGKNSQTDSRFASLDAVNKLVRPKLAQFGFSVSFSEGECKIDKWKRTVADLRHREGHAEQYYIDLPLDGFGAKGNAIGAMNPVQAAISTGTYGQRVLLCRIMNVAIADSDKDGNPPGDASTLNKEQIDMLAGLIRITGSDEKKFLDFAKAKSLAEIKQADFPKMRDALQAKKKDPEIVAALKEWAAKMDNVNSVDQLNDEILPAFKKLPASKSREAVWELIKFLAGEAGIDYNKDAGKFHPRGA